MRRKKLAPLIFIVLVAAVALGAVPRHGHLPAARPRPPGRRVRGARAHRGGERRGPRPDDRDHPQPRRRPRRGRAGDRPPGRLDRRAAPRRGPAAAGRSTWSAPPPSCGSGPCCSSCRPRPSTPPPRPRRRIRPPRPRRATTTTTTAAGDDDHDRPGRGPEPTRPRRSRTATHHHDDRRRVDDHHGRGRDDHHDHGAGEPAPAFELTPREEDLPEATVVLAELDDDGEAIAVYQLGPSQATGEIVADAERRARPEHRPVERRRSR